MHGKIIIWGAETPKPIATKFCVPGAVHDVVEHTNFDEDLIDLGFWRGEGSNFGIFHWHACFVTFTTL